MLDSKQDGELSELGATPQDNDVRSIVSRTLGERPVTLSYADELLEALTRSVDALAPPEPPRQRVSTTPAFGAPARLSSPVPPSGLSASSLAPPASSNPPVFAPSPPPPDVRPLFDSRPAPPSFAPPLFDARAVAVEPPKVFDAPREPDSEATAQAIQAAFDEPEPSSIVVPGNPHDTLETPAQTSPHLAAVNAPTLELETGRNALLRRDRASGSRRPDLDLLLEQPLDALDFERSEPLPMALTLPDSPTEPTPTPTAAAADDFEILVDDEILEIAEDDVEMMDEEDSR